MMTVSPALAANAAACAQRGARHLDRVSKGWALRTPPNTLPRVPTYQAGPGDVRYYGDGDAIDGGYYGFYPAIGPLEYGRPQQPDDTVIMGPAAHAALGQAWERIRARRVYLKELRLRRKWGQTPGTMLRDILGVPLELSLLPQRKAKKSTVAVKTGAILSPKKETRARTRKLNALSATAL